MLKNMVGVEVEFFLINKKDEVIVPPASWERDAFPLLGEIRGEPGKNAAEVYSNFIKREMEVTSRCTKNNSIIMDNVRRIKLAIYREATRQMEWASKDTGLQNIKNIYGTDITDFSDQIIGKNKKIQGINASCGLHIHFSSEEVDKCMVEEAQYEIVNLPLNIGTPEGGFNTAINLFKNKGWVDKKELIARASQLNQPTIEWIVKQMDDAFFEKFAPPQAERTKYRQPGFYELKPYGFEYRSLPANKESIDALPQIIAFAFELLGKLKPV